MAQALLAEPVAQDKQTVVTVAFYGTSLVTIKVNEEVFVAMRPIVEGMGLSWSRQRRKLQENSEKYGCGLMATPSEGGIQETLVIPLRKLNGWLFSVNPMKVKREIRDRLIRYQEECFVALYAYWNNGAAVNPRSFLSTASRREIQNLIAAKVSHYPVETRQKAFAEAWARVKNKFRVAKYEEIPEAAYQDVVLYIVSMEMKTTAALPSRAPVPAITEERPDTRISAYASIYKSLPTNTMGYKGLRYRWFKASMDFEKEMREIYEEARRPFVSNRRIDIETPFDSLLSPLRAAYKAAEQAGNSAYNHMNTILDGYVAAQEFLTRG